MQRISPTEDLNVAWIKVQNLDLVRRAIQNARYFREVLVALTNAGRVLKCTTFIRILYAQCYGEVVCVEMPGKAVTLFRHVDDDVRQWIRTSKERIFLKAILYEAVEPLTVVNCTKWTGFRKVIGRHEGIRTVKELPSRIVLGKAWIVLRKIDIGPVETAVAFAGDIISFGNKRCYALRRQKVLHDSTSVSRQV